MRKENMIARSIGALAASSVLIFASATSMAAIELGDLTVDLEVVAEGLTSPLKVVGAGDGSGRLFIVDQVGLIHIVDENGLRATPFLDIAHLLPTLSKSFDVRGLLVLAFHPNYAENGRFFVRHSAPRDGVEGEPCFDTSRGCHTAVLSEFAVTADPNVANPSETVLLEVDEPQFNHNGGDLSFGPDGFLYVGFGDGGGRNDGLEEDPPLHGPIGHGQNTETALGAMLRIDVNGGFPYSIPADNPFANSPGLDEIYAYGLRNPYRFSFDRANGRLFVADVGQGLFEEIDIVELGGNYGWVIREGLHCFDPMDSSTPPDVCPDIGLSGEPLLDPVAEYTHGDGISITGGNVYRGNGSNLLRGKYIFGDFSRAFAPADGRLFYLDADGDQSEIFELRLGNRSLPLGEYVIGSGEDDSGEVYIGTSTNLSPIGNAGVVYRVVASNRVTMCHVPRGNPGNAHTITIGQSAAKAHLRHGDEFGACPGDDETGSRR